MSTKRADQEEIERAEKLAIEKNDQRKVPIPAHYPHPTPEQQAVIDTPINHNKLAAEIQQAQGFINKVVYDKYRSGRDPIWVDKN